MAQSHQYGTKAVMARRARARRAMTLFEIIAVTFLVGIVSLAAVTRYSNTTIADVSAQGIARRIALDCSQARRRAIATGDNHLLRFTLSGGNATQYVLYRRSGGSTTVVDDTHPIPANVTVNTAGVVDIEFQYTGEALASYTITVTAPDRSLTITVPQVTGKAFVQ
jgi:hypothetical protein